MKNYNVERIKKWLTEFIKRTEQGYAEMDLQQLIKDKQKVDDKLAEIESEKHTSEYSSEKASIEITLKMLGKDNVDSMNTEALKERAEEYLSAIEYVQGLNNDTAKYILDMLIKEATGKKEPDKAEKYCIMRELFGLYKIGEEDLYTINMINDTQKAIGETFGYNAGVNVYGLFKKGYWTGEGNFCGWYGAEYYNDCELIAYAIVREREDNKVEELVTTSKHFDKLHIFSGIIEKQFIASNNVEAVEIFKNKLIANEI